MASDSTVIRTLRIRTAASDRLAARQQTERGLQAASLRPIGLPRDAILIVRQIKSRHAGAAGWEHAVNAQLDQLARQAARPIEGAVPAHAAAVIFADRSELLACLAADWCAGVVRAQWWWQSWLRGDDVTRTMIEAWLAAPEYIPLTLQRLSVRQQAVDFVQRLSDTHVRSLLAALLPTFGLYQLSLTLNEMDLMEAVDRTTINPLPAAAQPAPWQFVAPASSGDLPPERQVLLGVGLMLHAAPNMVRSTSFAAEVTAWHAAILASTQPSVSTAGTPTLGSPAPVEPVRQVAQESFTSTVVQPEEAITDQPSLRGGRWPAKQSPPEHHAESVSGEAATSSTPIPAEPNVPLTLPVAQPSIMVRDDAPALADVTPEPLIVETEFGGVCYFINLGIFLGFYGDFTTPLQPGLDLPIWDFMALVAQELIGEDVTRDPIWSLLAQLADRAEDEPPGVNFDPAASVIASRAAAKQSPASTTEIASSAYGLLAMTPLERWLADLMSIIRPRLQLALGVNADGLPRYFTQRARIVVSALTFDAYFALADLPIEIRLSGLDRDPGWVPAAGRTVRFHYD
jgi:hypothetical protein